VTVSPVDVRVELGERSYAIRIGSGLLDDRALFGQLGAGTACAIVTNETVAPLYAERLAASLRSQFGHIEIVVLPDGEVHKDWPALQRVFSALLESKCDRSVIVFALGGGVIGDLAGFAAACYMRGVRYVQVPTTLLAQVDSAVGGKTAINHALGKNMIGAFHQPMLVVADIDTLQTLPKRELVAGLAEVIKYGAIADDGFLDWIDSHMGELLSFDPLALAHAVRRSCEIKAAIVAADERESGVRATLNFGHTFGHAIETGLGHGAWLHGEAVGCGMVMAADLSVRLDLLPRAHADRITKIVARAGLPVKAPALGAERYLELMRVDKKADGGQLRFVVLDGPGQALLRVVEPGRVVETLEATSELA